MPALWGDSIVPLTTKESKCNNSVIFQRITPPGNVSRQTNCGSFWRYKITPLSRCIVFFLCKKCQGEFFSRRATWSLALRGNVLKCPHYKETSISRSILSVWTALWTGACPEGLHAKRLRCFLHSCPLIVVMSSLRHIQLPICHHYWGPVKAELDFVKGLLYISRETETRSLLIESQSLRRPGGGVREGIGGGVVGGPY